MKEPVSTVTNAAYLVAGAAIIAIGGPLAIYVGTTFILLGLASGWFHWTRAWAAQLTDERGMYVCFSALICATYAPLLPPALPIFMAAAIISSVFLVLRAEELSSFRTVPTLVVIMLVGVAINHSLMAAVWLLAGFAFTAGIRQTHDWSDALRPYTDLIHGVWHLSTAVYMYIVADLLLA